MKNFIQQLFKDKNSNYSIRELAVGLFIAVIVISWVARQFFKFEVPEFMFYSFVSLVGVGCFGYSFERKCATDNAALPQS